MTHFTKILMLISTIVPVIGGGFSFYFTYKSYQPVTLINENKDGIALDGFDVVSYHKSETAKRGEHRFQVSWADSIWFFSSLENRQAFSENPKNFAPEFGGYDPYGMAMNGMAKPTTPELWAITNGKLYLFYSGETRKMWQENMAINLKKANAQWAKLKQQIQYKSEID